MPGAAPITPAAPKADLPDAYGTERLFLTARDPHWLYASWDLMPEQRALYNGLARDRHLVVRVYAQEVSETPASEAQVHPESKSWFVHVARAGTRYLAQLGYYDSRDHWHSIATSLPTLTPPDSVSEDTIAEFATIPADVSLRQIVETVRKEVGENRPLVQAIRELRENGWKGLPRVVPRSAPAWTPAQARALAEVVRVDESRRVWMGSLEITELVRRHLQQEITSPAAREQEELLPAVREEVAPAGVSSLVEEVGQAAGGEAPFWFNVNAELVIYGATEPDAKVRVEGREIRLRPDGTFSFRFALPDGEYPLAITAASVDRKHRRSAKLRFSRATEVDGEVGAHPQDAKLKPPAPRAIE